MVTAGRYLFSSSECSDAGVGGLALSRLGSELALVYHDVVAQPLPRSLQRLVDQLDRELSTDDRSGEDTVTAPRAR